MDTLDDHIQKLLNLKGKRRASISSNDSAFRRTGSFIFTTSFSEKNPADERWDSVSSDWVQIEDIITTMESLAFHCKKGKRCCSCAIVCYRVAQVCSFLCLYPLVPRDFYFGHSRIHKWAQGSCLFVTRCCRRIETGRKINSRLARAVPYVDCRRIVMSCHVGAIFNNYGCRVDTGRKVVARIARVVRSVGYRRMMIVLLSLTFPCRISWWIADMHVFFSRLWVKSTRPLSMKRQWMYSTHFLFPGLITAINWWPVTSKPSNWTLLR